MNRAANTLQQLEQWVGGGYYVRTSESKKPVRTFGGWPIGPDHAGICDGEKARAFIEKAGLTYWAIVGTQQDDGRSLLVLDIDGYKMDEADREAVVHGLNESGLLDQTLVVESQSGGKHLYLWYGGAREAIPETIEHVDLKGEAVKGYALLPTSDDYTIINEPTDDELPSLDAEELLTLPVCTEAAPDPTPEKTPERDREPTTARADIEEIEQTDEIQTIYDAIEHLRPADLPLRSRKISDGTDAENWDPAYRSSQSNESLAYFGSGTFLDREDDKDRAFGVLDLYATEQGILNRPYDQFDGQQWRKAVEKAREAGAPIPEFAGQSGGEYVTLLPDAPIERMKRGAGASWDWRNAGSSSPGLSTDEVRERTRDAIADAYERGDWVLLDAIMSAGKSYGAIAAAADTDTAITVLTTRGRKEQYAQIQDWCDEHGLSSVVLPTIGDCDTYSGRYEDERDHAEAQKRAVREWYRKGATGKDIHIHAEEELGQPLVCDGPAGARCTYKVKWEALEPDEYDVLIGHYNHAHVQSVVQGRMLVLDEFPEDTYITEFGPTLASAVTAFLKRHEHVEALPADYADLMDVRTDNPRRSDALAWFLDQDLDRNGTLAFEQGGHAHAPLAAFTLLAAADNNLGNGFEHAVLPGQYGDHGGDGIGLYDREVGYVNLLMPPDLRYASGIVALDGTPVPDMWDIVLGANLNHRPVLTDGERADYITDTQQIDIIRTTEYVKPYSGNPDNVYLDEDQALLTEIADRHGQTPDLITTKTAEEVYENHIPDDDEVAILDTVNEYEHHGNVKGSNKFADSRLGAVIGSRHFGDRYVQQWGAFAGEAVERGEGRGVELEYSGIGAKIHQHMTHHETMQALMRFGRDGKGATIYVHTNTLPDWVPLAGEGRVKRVWSEGMKQVLDAANDYDEWRTSDLAEHPAVEIGERQIREHLHTLADRGDVSITIEGRGFTWSDDSLHRVSEYGDIELPPVELDDLTKNEVAELGGIESYTWAFRKNSGESGESPTRSIDETRAAGNRGGSPIDSLESGD